MGRNIFSLGFEHSETGSPFSENTNAVILATGYQYKVPLFLGSMNDHIEWLEDGKYHIKENYAIDRNNTIFVQNAELHTHGFNSADLGLGPYRNAIILNTILKREHIQINQTGNVFQEF